MTQDTHDANPPIPAEFEEQEPKDKGVRRRLVATEEFDFEGEPQVRTTELLFLDDGGLAINQSSEPGGIGSLVTLGANVKRRLATELGANAVDADDTDSTDCVLCDFSGETPEEYERHMERVHDA
jgi:hypothetical protein